MNADLPFRLLVGLVFAGVIWMVSRYRQGAQGGESISLEREGWALAVPLRLVGLVLWLYLPLYVLFPQLMSWSTLELPAAARWAGLAVGALAVPPFIFWAQRSLGSNVTSTVVTKQNHQLVTDGPYRYVRHPLYTAGLLFFIAMALATGSWLLLLAILTTFALLRIRTPKEEAELIDRFGEEYRRDAHRTGRFFPRLGRNR